MEMDMKIKSKTMIFPAFHSWNHTNMSNKKKLGLTHQRQKVFEKYQYQFLVK